MDIAQEGATSLALTLLTILGVAGFLVLCALAWRRGDPADECLCGHLRSAHHPIFADCETYGLGRETLCGCTKFRLPARRQEQ